MWSPSVAHVNNVQCAFIVLLKLLFLEITTQSVSKYVFTGHINSTDSKSFLLLPLFIRNKDAFFSAPRKLSTLITLLNISENYVFRD